MRREEEGREVDGEGGGGEAGGEEGGEGGKAVGSIKLIEFTTYCENVPTKDTFSQPYARPYARGTVFQDLDR